MTNPFFLWNSPDRDRGDTTPLERTTYSYSSYLSCGSAYSLHFPRSGTHSSSEDANLALLVAFIFSLIEFSVYGISMMPDVRSQLIRINKITRKAAEFAENELQREQPAHLYE